MDHLDLETILSSSSSASWMLPSFDQQDANFLSASRQMLEPIIEETSEDEENQNWPQYDNVWSSESETGSVIRIELHNDQDSISERDFACPAKRPRRDDLLIIEENISYKKYSQQRNDILAFNLSAINTGNNDNAVNSTDNFMYRKRFDEFYSDSDSLSYNSLSRSSSLIQFESLEKQLQAAELNNSSSLGNSSPSLLSIENNNGNVSNLDNNIACSNNNNNSNNNSSNSNGGNCNKNSTNCLRRFESSESGLHHQTYYDLDKIEFNNSLMFNDDRDKEDEDYGEEEEEDDGHYSRRHHHHHHRINKSDSESSDNSILSHEERIPKPFISSSVYSSSIMTGNNSSSHENRSYYKGRSSVENLSEDSGYCEHYMTGLKIKSKSIPNFLRYNEKCLDKNDDYDNYKSLETIISVKQQKKSKYNNEIMTRNRNNDGNGNGSKFEYLLHSRNENVDDDDDTFSENKIYPTTTTAAAATTMNKSNVSRKTPNEKQRESKIKIDTTTKRIKENNNEENSYQNQKQKQKPKQKQQNYESNEFMYSYNDNTEDQVKNKIYPNRRNQIGTSSSPLLFSPSTSSSPPLVLRGSLAFTQRREFSPDASPSSSSSSTSPTSSFSYQRRKKTSVLLYNSSSLPDIRIQYEHDILNGNNLNSDDPHRSYDDDDNDNFNFNSSALFSDLCHKKNTRKTNQFTLISSLPNDLNAILCDSISSERFNRNANNVNKNNDDCEFDWNLKSRTNKTPSLITKSENRSFIDTVNFNSCYSSLNQSAKLLSTSTSSSAGQNYMNASYNNLTLLDYSGRSRSNRNSFTMSEGSGNSKRNSREFEFGKGNFLLDEISSHFDKNLSILSDRGHNSDLVSEFLENEKISISENHQKPKPPARRSSLQKEQSTTAKKLLSSTTAIEKPPRKNLPNKTFDQDPTILKTNYTESLEKCNFDPKELSNLDLTEIQISSHSTPIKRGFVASTPNLNTFQRNNEEIDDDLHVCSAHTSMNPLPNEKKLGILLSEGSRTSLNKGVSFCPIVSEIRWREQSSEENVNPSESLENMKINHEIRQENVVNDYNQETITNTDEVDANITSNANSISQVYINANNNQNKALPPEINEQQQQQQQQQEKHELKLTSKPDGMLNSKGSETEPMKSKQKEATVSNVLIVEENITTTIGAGAGADTSNDNDKEKCGKENSNDNQIVNEKMLNCASVNKSDDQKRGSDKEMNSVNKIMSDNKNVNNNNVGIKSATIPMTSSTKTSGGNNKNFTVDSSTGTDLLSAKFKTKPDEKHHKNGFLSRFTGGFRFSLRRKKKPSLSTVATGDLNANENNTIVSNDKRKNKKNTNDGDKNMNRNTTKSNNSPDFIYIPLKGPLPGRQSQQYTLPSSNGKNRDDSHLLSRSENRSPGNENSHVLLGKPPLPKQPPRVVGVCEKVRTTPSQQQKTLSSASFQGIGGSGNYRHALESRSSSQPREIEETFLHCERQYYSPDNTYQLNGTMNENGCISPVMGTNNIITSLPPLPPTKCPVTRPAGISIGSTVGPNGNTKIGLIETNLDTHETIISGKTRSLMELGPQIRHTLSKQSAGSDSGDTVCIDGTSRRPHKSMEFLLDKENQKNAMPPENELQKSHDSTAALSEHQLRVQASLQRLNIPDWFRQYSPSQQKINDQTSTSTAYKPGNFTRKRASDSGRWAGLNSKTTSLSSLGSQRSDRSPLLLSPSAHSHHGGQIGFSRWSTSHLNSTQTSPSVSTRGSFSRGNAINSSFISGHSINSGSSIRNSFRQPYLGWRSQEKLTSPRTPHERLASSLLAQKPPKPEPAVTPEIQTSIKEVTSAIVHYVNDQTNRTARSRSTSPSSRKCWLESSFVGIRPVESPQTPTLDNNCSFNATPTSSTSAGITTITINQNQNQNLISSDLLRMNGVAINPPLPTLAIGPERSPSSASLEDVLASLLGLPTDSYRSTGGSANEMMTFRFTSALPNNSLQVDSQNRFRRRSEGDAQKQQKQQQQQQQQQQHQHLHQQQDQQNQQPNTNQLNIDLNNENSLSVNQPSRRVSLDSSESKTTSELLIKCRNTKCDQAANPIDAKKYYKSCHNCSHLYCSRECRRAHWEKHRKACLHSRVSNLCRQVLSSCKDDVDTLRHLSLLARKGYLSQGRGVVRVLFRSPENAEAFIKNGFQCLGEASYVRWPDLMPAEMGLELYSELLRLSTEYKPDSKMLIYVAICVVSEAPGTATAPVKWERQLVSRCAKLKLCKTILSEFSELQTATNTTITATNNLNSTNSQEQQTEILILTFNTQKKINSQQREMIITNIQTILTRRGVILRRHYPEIYQRLQNFIEGQNDRFMPVTIHPRDTQTGQGFVCIIMPILNENDLKHLPTSDTGNRVSIIDVGEDLLES